MKRIIMSICLFAAPSALMAQQAMVDLGNAAGTDAAALAKMAEHIRKDSQMAREVGIPRYPRDVFAGCSEIDAMLLRAPSLDEAVTIVQVCLDKVYKNPTFNPQAFSVEATKGRLGCGPRLPPTAQCAGIHITVIGKLLLGNPILMDLNYSINRRKNELLGWRVQLHDRMETQEK